jgi:hypothetical protein
MQSDAVGIAGDESFTSELREILGIMTNIHPAPRTDSMCLAGAAAGPGGGDCPVCVAADR